MATIRKIVLTCDRCAFGKVLPATTKRVFAIEDRYYQLDLCEQHGETFDRDFGLWTRLSKDIDNPYTNSNQSSLTFSREKNIEARRILDQSDDVAHTREKSLFAQREAERLSLEAEKQAYQLIPGAKKWTMSKHARERMMERNFTPAEVLMAVTVPATTRPDPHGRKDVVLCVRGDCRVIVNPHAHVILTVVDRSTHWDLVPKELPSKVSATN